MANQNTSGELITYENGAHFKYNELVSKLERIVNKKEDYNDSKIYSYNNPISRNLNIQSYINQEQDLNINDSNQNNITNMDNKTIKQNLLTLSQTKKSISKNTYENSFLTINRKNIKKDEKKNIKNIITKKPIKTLGIINIQKSKDEHKKLYK